MTDEKSADAIRRQVHAALQSLAPAQAKALRSRYGVDNAGLPPDEEDGALRALARELARLKKAKR